MTEHIGSHLVRLRCAHPRDHWDPAVGIGDRRVEHDENGEILVERGPHIAALLRAGYVIVDL